MGPPALLLAAVLLAAEATPLFAQSGKAELFGTVRDRTGLPLPGAQIEIQEKATSAVYRSASGLAGDYHFFALPTGAYQMVVQKEGFRTLRREGVLLRVADRVVVDLVLEVGDLSQVIDVVASAPLLQTAKGTVSFVADQQKVATLPLDGRNFVPLIALSPGVMLPPGSVFPRINGSRPRVSEYLYDGVTVLQPEPGQVAFYPVIDAIQEFRVEVNSYSAEYGRSNGGVILVNQKSGTNEFHGTLFEFFRNEKLNARNLFAVSGPKPRFRRNQYGFVWGGPVQRNKTFFFLDWQGTRLKTGVVRTSTVPASEQRQGVFTVPVYDASSTRLTESGYARDPFPGGVIPTARFDAATLKVLGRYPLPNVLAGGREAVANNYQRVGNDSVKQDQFDSRLDRHFGARQRVFGRYSYFRDSSQPTTPLPDGSGNITAGVIGDTLTRADALAVEHTFTISPSSVNQLRFGYTQRGFERSALRLDQPVSTVTGIPNIPTTAFSDALPAYQVVGYQQLGPPSSSNAQFTTSVTQLVENYSTVRGRHSLKAGSDIRLEHLDVLQPANPTGLFQFSPVLTSGLSGTGTPVANTGHSVASFLLGQVQSFDVDAQREVLEPRARIAEFFIQDDWQVSHRFSLNLGARYTLNFPSTETRDRGAVFNLKTQQLDLLGRNGYPRSARELEKADFGPRLGLSLRLTEALVLRAGYGLTWIEQPGTSTPFTTPLFPFVQTIGQRSLDNINAAFVLSQGPTVRLSNPSPDSGLGQGVFAVQRDNGSGYAQQWNVTLQKTFRDHWSVEAGYLGSKLTRLGAPDVNINQLTADQLRLGALLTQPVPNPHHGQIPATSPLGGPATARQQLLRPYPRFTTVALYRNNVGQSTYHSLQARVEKQLSKGLLFTAMYTCSKLMDDAGPVFDAAILTGPLSTFQVADSFNRRLEKDVSTGNIPHVFASGFVYGLPFGKEKRFRLDGWRNAAFGGWQLAGIVRLQSGSPVAVTQATNLNAFAGFGVQRPNRLRNPGLPGEQRSLVRYFDTNAFAPAPQFTIGNSSRNPVNGPGYRTVDLMAGKLVRITERLGAELRIEAFNATNTPPLGNPNGSFGAAAFGSITTALDPRVFELVMKLTF